jgi:hypothetical protein
MDSVASLLAGLASGDVEIVDLTVPLTPATPIIQLPPPFANTRGATTTSEVPPGTGTTSQSASMRARISMRRSIGSRGGTAPPSTACRCSSCLRRQW